MSNERGVTLIELLATLAIIGVIMALITSVFINGSKASERNTSNQRLQQEANYIVEVIRKEYLKLESDPVELKINNGDKTLKVNDVLISEGFFYCYENVCNDISFELKKNVNQNFLMTIKENDSLYFEIDTTFSKLR